MIRKWQDVFSESVLLFLFFDIIGWIYEVVLAFMYGHGFVNRGFLFGPYLPLYGSGALILIFVLGGLMKKDIRVGRINVKPIAVFLMIMLVTTTLEYVVGWFMESVFHQQFWNYSDYKWQLHGRICVSASLRFGLGGMVFLYILVPLFRKMLGKLPLRFRQVSAILIVILMAADLAATLYFSNLHGFNPALAQPR